MLDCIKKIIKRGKRPTRPDPKGKTPWALPQNGIFNARKDIGKQYDFEVSTYILKKKMHKGPQGYGTKVC